MRVPPWMRLFTRRENSVAAYPKSYHDPRPEPDAAELTPQPERSEAPVADPGLEDVSWFAILKRAGKAMLSHNLTMVAQALAYSTFMAIPAVLLVVVGLFTLLSSRSTIDQLMAHLHTFMPGEATQLLKGSLHQLDSRPSTSIAMTVVGLVLAIWTTTGAMTSYMTALNLAYDRRDRRSFVKKRLVAVLMAGCIGGAFLLIAALLIFGPELEAWVGRHLGIQPALAIVWWVLQWPILIAGLLAAFAALLYLGPDVDHPRWRFLTPGSVVAALIWLVASGAFALYTSNFSSYNKTWGSLSAVIVTLVWLWLTGLALLFGAEINAETERSRELRRGEPASRAIEAPARA